MPTSYLPGALLIVASIASLVYRPTLTIWLLILSLPLVTLPLSCRILEVAEDYWIGLPGQLRPWLQRTKWRPGGQNQEGDLGLLRLGQVKGDVASKAQIEKGRRRLVLVTGADGGVGLETTVALLLVNCDVLMGIKDLDLPKYWSQVQDRLNSRLEDELNKPNDNIRGEVGSREKTMNQIGRPIPFKCDFSHLAGARAAAQEVWNVVSAKVGDTDDINSDSQGQAPSSKPGIVGIISHYIGTVGIGFDRPTAKGILVSRYTENDDGLEWQLGINAVNPFLFSLLIWPLIVQSTRISTTMHEAPSPLDGRIILTNSIAHAWNSLPLAVPPSYESWEIVKSQGQRRWTAGRYNYSKLTQLLLLTSLQDLSPSLLSALSRLVSPCSPSPSSSPSSLISPNLLALHPGEVNTPFLDLMLPTWRWKWIEKLTCLSPKQGAWTGLWGCVTDLRRAKVSRKAIKGESRSAEAWRVENGAPATDVGYHYLHSLCTFGKPASLARDEALIEECWSLVGMRMARFLRDNEGEEDGVTAGADRDDASLLTFHTWERSVGEVLTTSLS